MMRDGRQPTSSTAIDYTCAMCVLCTVYLHQAIHMHYATVLALTIALI